MNRLLMLAASARPLAESLIDALRAGPRMIAGWRRHMLRGG
jgi:hypothetical protein